MSRYFCRNCNQGITRTNANFTCPTCFSGYIEKVDEANVNHGALPWGGRGGASTGVGLHQLNPQNGFIQHTGFGLSSFHGLTTKCDSNRFPPSLQGQSQSQSQITQGQGQQQSIFPTVASTSGLTTSHSQSQNQVSASGGHYHHQTRVFIVLDSRLEVDAVRSISVNLLRRRGTSRVGGGSSDHLMENISLSIKVNFTNHRLGRVVGGGRGRTRGENTIAFSRNINLGDYAWSQGGRGRGLDATATQLPNNLEGTGTGPPPMSADRLSQLNRIQISKDQVEAKLKCTVCCEDFSRGENVINLDCGHIYHNDCILRWLKLRATCPVCRKDLSLLGQSQSQSQGQENEGGRGVPSFNSYSSLLLPSISNHPSTTATASSSSAGSYSLWSGQGHGPRPNSGALDEVEDMEID